MAPGAFLYADTDCVVFSKPVALPLDPKRYGYWKLEDDGVIYRLITKKVYFSADFRVRHAKGLNVGRLTQDDFERWYKGEPPKQIQIQRVNWLKVMDGQGMFVEREKYGQKPIKKVA